MIIECISNLAEKFPNELIRPELGLGRDRVFSLKVGKQYVVYAITCNLGHLWYYICDEDYSYYPIWNPSLLFRIVDNRLSSFWRIGMYAVGSEKLAMPIISFEKWVNNPIFYDQLTDGESNAGAIFRKYKELMDEEATQTSGNQ